MLLALETSTDICSVAFRNRNGSLFEKRSETRGTHSEQLFLFIRDLMEEHEFAMEDLKAVLVSEGPGSYTGLRISASAVKGLLFQTDIPLFAVGTLAGFAQSVFEADQEVTTVHSVIDARRVHLYHQKFSSRNGNITAETEVRIIPVKEVQETIKSGEGMAGTGIKRIEKQKLEGLKLFRSEYITARSLIRLFEKGDSDLIRRASPESYEPKYMTTGQTKE